MSSEQETRKLLVELLRRGATLLREPCPRCGGLMVRYKGVTFCPRCWGTKSIEEIEERVKPPEELLEETRRVVMENLKVHVTELKGRSASSLESGYLGLIREELEVLKLLYDLRERIGAKGS